MSSPVAVQARRLRAALFIGVHPRFRFPGRPGGAGLAKRYQLGWPHRMSGGAWHIPAGRDGSVPRRISVAHYSLDVIVGETISQTHGFIGSRPKIHCRPR
jgi:hypothetical protein